MLTGTRPRSRSCRVAALGEAASSRPWDTRPLASAARHEYSGIVAVLRYTQQLLQAGRSGRNLAQTILVEGQHAGAGGQSVQLALVAALEDGFAHLLVDHQQFVNGRATLIAGFPTLRTADRAVSRHTRLQETPQSRTGQQRACGYLRFLAVAAQGAHQPL